MKHLLKLIIAVFFLSSIIPQGSFSQNSQITPKTKTSKDIKKGVKVSKQEVLNKINKNTKSFKKDIRGTWLLEEDFESGNFPPTDWWVSSGSEMWQQAFYSGYGNGNYSMFYSSWNCYGSDNTIYTSTFPNTQFGDQLIFDYAYAPRTDGPFTYYDALDIYYYDKNDEDWYSFVYYDGTDLQTAPETFNYFQPQSNEWGTKFVNIPEGATQLYFQVYEGCSNNLYIDNIRVGAQSGGGDASVEFVWAKGKLPLAYGVPETIPVLIKNTGVTTMFNLDVYLDITGANNLSDMIQIPVLGPGDTMQVDFMGFTPILNGFCDVTVSIPSDNDPNNNSKTFLTEVNPNVIRHVDSNCCNSSVGWIGEFSFLNKYYMSGTGQIRQVNIKLSNEGNVGQIVYGYVIANNGTVLGKSPHYKIQPGDVNQYKTFYITDPSPVIVTNDYYYVGIAQTEYAGDGFVYTPQQLHYEIPARPSANYGGALAPPGTVVGTFEFPREYGQNYAIEAVIGDQVLIDNGISNPGLIYDQYFTTTMHTPVVKVFNAGTALSSFNIRRTITPGGYTSTQTVSGLVSGGNANVTFDPWTFTSGTTYTIRDSILTFDGNTSNNQMTSTITPRVAKQLCVLWQQQEDRDSLVRAINADGRYANNFDTVRMNYTGSFRPWRILFVNFGNEKNYSPWMRDSLKMFIDNSTAGNKKSLVVFGNVIAFVNDPNTSFQNPADSVFYRQYIKAKTISDNWPGSISASENRFRGIGFFNGITQDSLWDPGTPELIMPTNGSSAAFKPQSVTGNGADSCNAVSFTGTSYNTFFMTNKFSSLRANNGSPSSPMGPVIVYTKIIDWIQSVNSGSKVLDLTAKIEGFYDANSNSMIGDTMRAYLRGAVNPYPKIDSAKAYLNSAGQASFIFNNASNGIPYYIELKHRSGLETWSKTTQVFSSDILAYDFTTDAAKAFGNNLKLQGSSWVLYGGDVNQDGFVNLTDVLAIHNNAITFTAGYVYTDVNGDNITDLTDLVLAYNNSNVFVQKVTPLSGTELFVKYGVDQSLIFNNQLVKESGERVTESNPDHEIYEMYKNQLRKINGMPDQVVIDNNNSQTVIKGSKMTIQK